MSSIEEKRIQRELLERLQVRLEFDSLKLALNDLLPLTYNWGSSLNELEESLEHAVFYLHSPKALSIKIPMAWLLKQWRAGYYGASANFISWQDQQAVTNLSARQQQAEPRQQEQIKMLQADSNFWLADLTTEERRVIIEASDNLKLQVFTPPM